MLELERDRVLDFHATRIQAHWRRIKVQRSYLRLIRGITKIQALVRGFLARQHFRQLLQNQPRPLIDGSSGHSRSEMTDFKHLDSMPEEMICRIQAMCRTYLTKKLLNIDAELKQRLIIVKTVIRSAEHLAKDDRMNPEVWESLHNLHRQFAQDFRVMLYRGEHSAEQCRELAELRFERGRAQLMTSFKPKAAPETKVVPHKNIPASQIQFNEELEQLSSQRLPDKPQSKNLDKLQKFATKYFHSDQVSQALKFKHGWIAKPLTKLTSNNDHLAAIMIWEMINRFMNILPEPSKSDDVNRRVRLPTYSINSCSLFRKTYFGPIGCVNAKNASVDTQETDLVSLNPVWSRHTKGDEPNAATKKAYKSS
ncbi:Unconventional myosin-VIIb [Cichlidogyrus casuarinus]|uniref:Unconventional myosin-VIIb n=1 Tax=Cichlidogyrus casuarinus TaxID=1844966 RepID=A0ABD2QMH3_9PLAT